MEIIGFHIALLGENAPFMAKAVTEGGRWNDGGPWEPSGNVLLLMVWLQLWFCFGGSSDHMT